MVGVEHWMQHWQLCVSRGLVVRGDRIARPVPRQRLIGQLLVQPTAPSAMARRLQSTSSRAELTKPPRVEPSSSRSEVLSGSGIGSAQ